MLIDKSGNLYQISGSQYQLTVQHKKGDIINRGQDFMSMEVLFTRSDFNMELKVGHMLFYLSRLMQKFYNNPRNT